MNATLQTLIVALTVAAAAAYLGFSLVKRLRKGSGSCGSGCGCDSGQDKPLADAPSGSCAPAPGAALRHPRPKRPTG